LTLTVHEGGALGSHLRYSAAIGLSCLVFAEGARSLLARLRAAAGWSLESRWGIPVIDLLVATALATAAGPVLGTTLVDLWARHPVPTLLTWNEKEVQISFLLAGLGTLVTLSLAAIAERASAEAARARAAHGEASEFRLQLLELQLDPHLLANTLAHLRAVLDEDPGQAKTVVDRLIAFFKATLAGGRAGAHSLQQEASRVEDYLAIIQMRMGARLRYCVTVPAELRHTLVPALITQPLVENAVRHGIEPKVGPGAIDVVVRAEGDRLLIDVRDTGRGFDEQQRDLLPGSGFGIQQVRERLRSVYGDGASLTYLPACPARVADDRGGVIARLALPLDPATRGGGSIVRPRRGA
jgi:LytS/YehU family sensor histidine kinase